MRCATCVAIVALLTVVVPRIWQQIWAFGDETLPICDRVSWSNSSGAMTLLSKKIQQNVPLVVTDIGTLYDETEMYRMLEKERLEIDGDAVFVSNMGDHRTLKAVARGIENSSASGGQNDLPLRMHAFYMDGPLADRFAQPQELYDIARTMRTRSGSHFYLGQKDAKAYLHQDPQYDHCFHSVLTGKKRFTLFSSTEASKLYLIPFSHGLSSVGFGFEKHRSQARHSNKDAVYPGLALAKGCVAEVSAGEMLYMPPGVFHTVEYLSNSLAMLTGFRANQLQIWAGRYWYNWKHTVLDDAFPRWMICWLFRFQYPFESARLTEDILKADFANAENDKFIQFVLSSLLRRV